MLDVSHELLIYETSGECGYSDLCLLLLSRSCSFNAPVGASACVAILEDIALGADKLYSWDLWCSLMKILKRLLLLFLVMPRDEGTSFLPCGSQR